MKPALTRILLAVVLLPLLCLIFYCHHRPPLLNRNLIVNADAEDGPGSPDGTPTSSIPGWMIDGKFNVVRYGASGYPSPTAPGPANRGLNFFSGGQDVTLSTARQTINVSSAAPPIDGNSVACRLSAYLGGWGPQEDNATLTAEFQGSDAAKLGVLSIGPVTAEERQKVDALLLREATAPVPAGTRRIVLTMKMVRYEGTADDGYADNLSLVLLPKN